MTLDTSNALSFWQLITCCKIEIPMIQRDYAQGRADPKAANVRKQLISKMLEANGQPLSFDFVYGQVLGETFIPIDGQQRLTTLFLFHLYLLKRCAVPNTKCPSIDKLKKFTYATRQSSREFCLKIVEKNIIPTSGNIEDFVKDQSWFYPDWAYDPTIAGILRTLEEIHSQMKGKGKERDSKVLLHNLLSDTSPITFQFLDMGQNGLTDDLYLKMNARGLPLTPWENFKAHLEQYLKEKYQDLTEPEWLTSFSKNLDGIWLDAFWEEFSKDGPQKPEQQILAVFRRHFLNVWVLRTNNKTEDTQIISSSLSALVTNDQFTPFSVYKAVMDTVGIDVAIAPIVYLFTACMYENPQKINLATAPSWSDVPWNPFVGNWAETHETFASRVRFYAVMKCFYSTVDLNFTTQYPDWMRVVWNILEDRDVENANYQSALMLIDELGGLQGNNLCWNNILNGLASPELKIVSQFAKDQVTEETQKAKLLSNGNYSEIRDAEANPFFKGSIRFLMHGPDWESKFKDRLDKVTKFFSGNPTLIFRAFVSRFTCWPQLWNGFEYDTNYWRRFLRHSTVDAATWREPFFIFIDEGNDKIFNEWISQPSGLVDWHESPEPKCEEMCKTAHEIIYQSEAIGNCTRNSILQNKDDCYMLLPSGHWAEGKKVVLDKRQTDLRKLTGIKIHNWQDKNPIVGTDVYFQLYEIEYVWWRDGSIYAWDVKSNAPQTLPKYHIDKSGQLFVDKESINDGLSLKISDDNPSTTSP